MTAAQRATLEHLRLRLGVCDTWRLAETQTGRDECGNCCGRIREHQQADALRAALGTCGTCAHADTSQCDDGWSFCAAPSTEPTRYPFMFTLMPLGERCNGYTPKEGA